MIDYLIEIDTDVFFWLNSSHAPFWDVFMKMATGKLIWVGMYAALVYAIWRAYGWRTMLVMIIASAIVVTLADQITAHLMRPYFGRLRPAHPDNPISPMVHIVDGYRAGRLSFPSSHAANTFAVATLMSLLFRRWKFTIFIFLWALLNCYSRVYLGVHYPGDLIVGMIVGTLIGWIIYIITKIVLSYWKLSHGKGQHDNLMQARVGSLRFKFRPIDVPITVEIITIVYITFCAMAIFF